MDRDTILLSLRSRASTPRMIGALSVALVTATLTPGALADEFSWNASDGWFFDPANWTPNGVPTSNDTIRIGNLPGVQNSTVTMGGELTQSFDTLEVSSGMTLDTNGTELISFGVAHITGANSRIIARPQPLGPNQHDFQADLRLGAGAYLQLEDNVPVRLFGQSQSDGIIQGRGTIIVASAIPFANRGVLRPSANGGLNITAGTFGKIDIDLDGNLGGDGQLDLSMQFSVLDVTANALTDSFSGSILMAPGAYLNMDIAAGWTADANSTLNVAGFGNAAASSQIGGTDFAFGGTMTVGGAEGHLRVLAPTTIQSSAIVDIGDTDWLEFDGPTTVEGGQFTLGQGGLLDFDGSTTMLGGHFTTASNSLLDGSVDFNGATDWSGEVTIDGAARQIGDATVSGGLGAVINAGLFDMDGVSGDTAWSVNSNLVVNAERIGTTAANRFDGTMDVSGGFLARATINLDDPGSSWIMGGAMNLTGSSPFYSTRVAGSHMIVEGELNVTSGLAQISADATFSDVAGGADIGIGPASAGLRMTGRTIVQDGVHFIGQGTLRNGATGYMTLENGVSLGEVGLVNDGLLEIDILAGRALVDRFENTASGLWDVSLGGYLRGVEHDLLSVVGGSAILDGSIEVALIDLGFGTFAPEIGDEFTILAAADGVIGAFLNDPVSIANGYIYEWSVLYEPNTVLLHLDDISVPGPAPLAMLGAGGVCLMRRRRRS